MSFILVDDGAYDCLVSLGEEGVQYDVPPSSTRLGTNMVRNDRRRRIITEYCSEGGMHRHLG